MKKCSVIYWCLLVLLVCVPAGAQAESVIDWASVFNADGSVSNTDGSVDAVFIDDNISAGLATDMSALDASGNVFNGPVPSAHDIGNGFVVASKNQDGELTLSAAVERFNTRTDTFVEFEFNQEVVGVEGGNPWPVYGIRTTNDFVLTFNFSGGNLASVDYAVWDGSAYQAVSSLAPASTGCFSDAFQTYNYCNGGSIEGLPGPNDQLWDKNFEGVDVPDMDGFVEAKINVGTGLEFSSVTIRTPKDIAFGSFQAMGYWASVQ